jgi:hypothetical protein
MSPWTPWLNLRPFTVAALDLIEEAYWPSRLLSRSFASQQDPRFPPVSEWQWLFGIFQAISRIIEPILVIQSRVRP